MTIVNDEVILLFGGYGSGGRLNDLWALDPITLSWTEVNIPGIRPSRRSHHTAVAMQNKLVLFGGLATAPTNDLWELNTKPATPSSFSSPSSATVTSASNTYSLWQWHKIELSKNPVQPQKLSLPGNIVGPAARYGHAACILKGWRMFLFAGVAESNAYKDDLWYLYIGTHFSIVSRFHAFVVAAALLCPTDWCDSFHHVLRSDS